MNYRHAFHAGNFADVLKHIVLVRILVHLREKPAAFRVIDTHAGAGRYDLLGPEAGRTGEWRGGIARLLAAPPPADVAALLAPYLAGVDSCNPGAGDRRDAPVRYYPGSPLLALSLLRPQDRLVACETEPSVAADLARTLAGDRRANIVAIDGYVGLNAYVPPQERRGIVLIDPPFEQPDEFSSLVRGVANAWAKWPTGIYLLWYPLKDRRGAAACARALAKSDIRRILCIELDVGAGEGLAAAGLLVINPPWRLTDDMKILLTWLGPLLARAGNFSRRLEWVRGEK